MNTNPVLRRKIHRYLWRDGFEFSKLKAGSPRCSALLASFHYLFKLNHTNSTIWSTLIGSRLCAVVKVVKVVKVCTGWWSCNFLLQSNLTFNYLRSFNLNRTGVEITALWHFVPKFNELKCSPVNLPIVVLGFPFNQQDEDRKLMKIFNTTLTCECSANHFGFRRARSLGLTYTRHALCGDTSALVLEANADVVMELSKSFFGTNHEVVTDDFTSHPWPWICFPMDLHFAELCPRSVMNYASAQSSAYQSLDIWPEPKDNSRFLHVGPKSSFYPP